VVDRAAVEGRASIAAPSPSCCPRPSAARLDGALAGLARRQLIRPARASCRRAGYRFVHILVRDVVTSSCRRRAGDLHERYAAWLDERVGPAIRRARRLPPRAGAPLACRAAARASPSAARSPDQAAARSPPPRTRRFERGDLPGGVNLLERTAALLPPMPRPRAPVLPELALALVQLGELPRPTSSCSEAIRIARQRGDELAEATPAPRSSSPHPARARCGARRDLRRASTRFISTFTDGVGRPRLSRGCTGRSAFVHWLAGRTARADAAWKRGVRHSPDGRRRAGGRRRPRVAGLGGGVRARTGPGRDQRLPRDPRPAALGPPLAGPQHAPAASLLRDGRRLRPSPATSSSASHAIHDELGVSLHAVLAQDEADVQLHRGQPVRGGGRAAAVRDPARRDGRQGAARDDGRGSSPGRSLAQHRDDEAWELLDTVDEAAAPDDLSAQMLRRIVRAELLARLGDTAAADRLSGEAVAIAARPTGSPSAPRS
jgi:hypothetical protein